MLRCLRGIFGAIQAWKAVFLLAVFSLSSMTFLSTALVFRSARNKVIAEHNKSLVYLPQ